VVEIIVDEKMSSRYLYGYFFVASLPYDTDSIRFATNYFAL